MHKLNLLYILLFQNLNLQAFCRMIISKSIFFPKKIHPENFNLNTKLHQNLEPIKDHFQYLKNHSCLSCFHYAC